MILFYSPASPSIGYGHLSRCLNLADAALDFGFRSTFAVQDDETAAARWICSRGHLPEVRIGSDDPMSAMKAYASSHEVEWVVVDSYLPTPQFLAEATQIAKLAVIEDHIDRDLRTASLVVCLAPGAQSSDLETSDDAVVLAGTTYALVADEFVRRRPASLTEREFGRDVVRVGVAMGGTDSAGHTQRVVSALADRADLEIRVAGELQENGLDEEAGKVDALGFLSSESMAELMIWSDLFIASASTLTWELATMGVPSCFVITAPNQKRIARYLKDMGVPVAPIPDQVGALAAPLFNDPRARADVAKRLSSVCDGAGARRVAVRLTG